MNSMAYFVHSVLPDSEHSPIAVPLRAKLFNGFVISNPSGRFSFVLFQKRLSFERL